jgi:hypothetical protein
VPITNYLGNEAAAHPLDGSLAGTQGRHDVFIVAAPPRRLISQQEDACMAELASGLPLPVETRRSNPTRSSVVSVTRYFSIAGLLLLTDTLQHDLQETVFHNTRQSKFEGLPGESVWNSDAWL